MEEGDAAGVEGDAAVGVGARGAVFEVALDGAADRGKLTADLMMTAGQQLDFDQVVTVRVTQHLVAQDSMLAAVSLVVVRVAFVLFFIAIEPVLQLALRRLGPRAGKRPVELVDLAVAEHGVETLQTFRRLRKDGDAAHRPVEPVRNPHENMTGLRVTLRDERLQRLAQRLVARLVPLDNLRHPLVKYQQVIVFIQNTACQVRAFFGCQLSIKHSTKIQKKETILRLSPSIHTRAQRSVII